MASVLATQAAELADQPITEDNMNSHCVLLRDMVETFLYRTTGENASVSDAILTWQYLNPLLRLLLRDPAHGEAQRPYKITKMAVSAFTGLYKTLFKSLDTLSKGQWDELASTRDQLLAKWPSCFPLPYTNMETQLYQSLEVNEALTKLAYQVIILHTEEPANMGGNGGLPSWVNVSGLQTQGSALLDTMVGLLADDLLLPPALFATINSCLVSLFRSRASLVNQRFLNITLAYESQFKSNPKYPLHPDNLTVQTRLVKRFNDRVNKVMIALVLNKGFLNSGPQLPFKQRFEKKLKYLTDRDNKLKQKKVSITSDEWDLGEDVDEEMQQRLKRRKLDSNNLFFNESKTPLEDDWASVYTFIRSHDTLTQFDMSSIEPSYLASMVLLGLAKVQTKTLVKALDIVQDRYKWLTKPPQQSPQPSEAKKSETPADDDEYDPSAETTVNVKKEPLQVKAPVVKEIPIDDNFVLPPPPKLDALKEGDIIKSVIDDMITALPKTIASMPTVGNQESLQKLQAKLITSTTQFSPEAQLVILIRLATRGLNEAHSKYIREALLDYFKQDWKPRMNGLVWWLNEEWYAQYKLSTKPEGETPYLHYLNLFMDHLISFAEMSDRAPFIRFLSELPLVPQEVLSKVRAVCMDPMRMKLGFQSLLFLMMFRPPMIPDAKAILTEIKDHATATENESVLKEATNLLNKFI